MLDTPATPRPLYEEDVVAWADLQAAAIRAFAITHPGVSNVIDWENVAEEIESVGSSETNAVASQVSNILVHLLKLLAAPEADAVNHWRKEIAAFHDGIERHWTKTIARKLDLDAEWRRARRIAERELADFGKGLPPHLPSLCPLNPLDFAGEAFDTDAALARLRPPATGTPLANPGSSG
jgi:hypothetical protein